MDSIANSGGPLPEPDRSPDDQPPPIDRDQASTPPHGVDGVLQIKRDDQRDVHRQVFVRKAILVEKVYLLDSELRDRRHSWKFEDRALRQLEGLRVPRSYGYHYGVDAQGQAICVLTKEYVTGETPAEVDDQLLEKLAVTLAEFHRRRVVTNDSSLDNMLLSDQGDLQIFDFSKARTFKRGNPLLYYYMGRELYKIRRKLLDRRNDLYGTFCSYYFSSIRDLGWIRIHLVRLSAQHFIRRDQARGRGMPSPGES